MYPFQFKLDLDKNDSRITEMETNFTDRIKSEKNKNHQLSINNDGLSMNNIAYLFFSMYNQIIQMYTLNNPMYDYRYNLTSNMIN